MKKFLCVATMLTMFASTAGAQTIMVMDANGNMTQQIYAYPASQTTIMQSQPVAVQPQQVITVQPYQPQQQVVVVRQTAQPRSYYYDSAATSFFAGLTGAVIGHAIFRPHHHGRHYGRHHR